MPNLFLNSYFSTSSMRGLFYFKKIIDSKYYSLRSFSILIPYTRTFSIF